MVVLASESLFLHRIAEGLVDTRGDNKMHATKQIDRLLSVTLQQRSIESLFSTQPIDFIAPAS
ncbi:hypothetical protein [Legionella cincinnatiensis]|uniref:Uncharacterized protein n=1 Tax=Legionella cincinnatiensis TaxID=28085 RepID=A0A378IJJ4_9GAMM|nr:hypothetical protein [Legionella cincinnatiensis]KTC78748.1 hypothetical protein Lcin_3363 [Legionella cincinnatiensis]STX35339.1 Uncharacterised protein [Legionella cincinnatiensis]